MPTVLFRCDGGPDIGIGHVMRCRTLAAAFREHGWNSAFAMSQGSAAFFGDDDPVVVPDGIAGAAATRSAVIESGAGCLVVDHYGLDAEFERQTAHAGCVTIAIDDLANRPHHCDILLDTNPARTGADYAMHVARHTKLLLGGSYALLRPEFTRLRTAKDPAGARPGQLVMAAGGADPANVSMRLLGAVPQLGAIGLKAMLIVGQVNPRAPDLIELGQRIGVEVVCNPRDPVALMANADIAICGAGQTCLEFACLGVPTVAMILADNQRAIAKAMSDAGVATILDGSAASRDIAEAVNTLAADADARQRMRRCGQALIDGRGASRVAVEAVRLHAVRKLEQCL